ncbi:MAG: TrmH family RNA methyltransferase [Prochlorotrichaceae cyanobacterium]|jgi:TrmH family RNA methyltransferase
MSHSLSLITSRQNPLVKKLRSLHSVKGRWAHQEFLLEGTHLIEAALRVNYPLALVCASDRWCDRHPDLWTVLEQQVPHQSIFSDDLLDYAASTLHPDGILATAPLPTAAPLHLPQTLGILLETIQDPGNVGTIVRTAAAVGLTQVWLTADSVDLTHPKLLRASAGAWFDVSLQICDHPLDLIDRCHQDGVQVIATSSHAQETYWDIDFSRRTLLLMGNEGAGLSPHLQAKADRVVTIPLNPEIESLNVSIATALLLYEAKRQRIQGSGQSPLAK